MTTLGDIDVAYAKLKEWRDSDPETRSEKLASINWTYDGDKHIEATEHHDLIVMGFNPGAGNGATAEKLSPGEKRWRTNCERISAGLFDGFVLAELIPISSSSQFVLERGFGKFDQLICAGAPVNISVIKYHKPRLILQVGIGSLNSIMKYYSLADLNIDVRRPFRACEILLRHLQMEDGTPWIAIRHFNSHGFSTDDRLKVREYLNGIMSPRNTSSVFT